MNVVLSTWQVFVIALVIAGGQFLASTWLKASIENSIRAKYDLELKAKERAERVAEYMALARMLKEESSEEDYLKANRLSWNLRCGSRQTFIGLWGRHCRSQIPNTTHCPSLSRFAKSCLGVPTAI